MYLGLFVVCLFHGTESDSPAVTFMDKQNILLHPALRGVNIGI